ncbi:MAG: hypothetical protein GWO85_00510 [Simkaniaceae bacterium]|nr:hypothetical protein [Simkaniaceae bacterium]
MKGTFMSNYDSTNIYLNQKVMTASPEQLIIYIFDAGIASCSRKDKIKAEHAVQELINALNFKEKELSTTFFQVYRHIQYLIQNKKFGDARELLVDLRSTWKKAMNI